MSALEPRAGAAIRRAVLLLGLAAAARAGISVDVQGNKFFSDREIKEFLPLDPKRFEEDDLRDWQEDAIFEASDHYRRGGFFDAKVDLDLQPGSGPEDWKAVLKVTEESRYLFDTVAVVAAGDSAGAGPADEPLLAIPPEALAARQGKPFQEDLIFADRRTVQRKFGDAGFVRAQVDDRIAIKPETKTVRIDYLVNASHAVVFDTLVIRDQRAPPYDSLRGITDASIFQGLLPYRRGDTVRVSGNDRLIEKLQYTGAFNYVRLRDSLIPGPSRRSALTLVTEEHVPGSFRFSLFYENLDGPGVSLDASHNNVAGSLNQLRSGFSVAQERQRLYAGYGSPLTFGYLIRFDDDVDANWSQADPVPPNHGMFGGDWRASNSARVTWPWSYWLRLVGNAQLESKSLIDSSGRTRSLNLNYIQTAALSFVNQPLDPTRGVRAAFNWGNGGPFIEDAEFHLADRRHNWLEAQTGYYYYYPPLRQVKLALRLDGGRFFGEGGTNSERFFMGGGRSVRSFGFHELCPEKDSKGFCRMDSTEAAYFLTSFETRMALFDFGFIDPRGKWKALVPLQTVAFVDFGKVWNLLKAVPGSQGRAHAYGLGLRYPLLGIFNFRLDAAWGRKDDSGTWKWPRGEGWPDAWILDLAEAF